MQTPCSQAGWRQGPGLLSIWFQTEPEDHAFRGNSERQAHRASSTKLPGMAPFTPCTIHHPVPLTAACSANTGLLPDPVVGKGCRYHHCYTPLHRFKDLS